MKRAFPFLFLLVIATSALGQNYKPFVTSAKQYFVNNYGYLRGMRIDSILPGGNNVMVYHPFRTPRGASGTLDSKGGSWLGKTVMAEQDGSFLFFTTWKDTVLIKTQAQVGERWTFLNDSSNRHYVAEVTGIDVMNVAGNADSVKHILITAWENNFPNPADSFHEAEILLSKNFGFAQVFDLYMFPYHNFSSTTITNDYYFKRSITEPIDNLPAYGPASTLPVTQKPGKYNCLFRQIDLFNPTYADMAEGLQVGDVLRYNTCEDVASLCPSDTPWQCHLDTIIFRNQTSSAITFTMKGVEATFADTGYYILNSETASTLYSDLVPVYTTDLMPEEIKQPNFLYYFPDDTSYCRPGLMVLQVANFIRTNYTINTSSRLYRIYKMGLGKTKSYNLASGVVLDTTTTFVRSANIACSSSEVTPYTLSVSGKKMSESVKVYPNPAGGNLFVETPKGEAALISVVNITGQVLMTVSATGGTTRLDMSGLSPGVYTLYIRSASGTAYAKVVKNE